MVRLAHYTTQEYFKQTHKTHLSQALETLASACLKVLSCQKVSGAFTKRKGIAQLLNDSLLYLYAASYWPAHALPIQSAIKVEALGFLESSPNLETAFSVYSNWQSDLGYVVIPDEMNGLHYCAYLAWIYFFRSCSEKRETPSSEDF